MAQDLGVIAVPDGPLMCRRCGKNPDPGTGELQVCDDCGITIYLTKVVPAKARGALDIAADVIMRKYGRLKPLRYIACD